MTLPNAQKSKGTGIYSFIMNFVFAAKFVKLGAAPHLCDLKPFYLQFFFIGRHIAVVGCGPYNYGNNELCAF